MSTDRKNFILEYQIDDLSICDDLVEHWKNSPRQRPGTTYTPAGDIIINKDFKDSIDVSIYPDDIEPCYERYVIELQKAVNKYIEIFPACNWAAPWSIMETIAIQYYPPGGGYKTWHSERCVPNFPQSTRHLVWMTYLNTVDDEGGTEFLHQGVKVKAEKGKTLIWPADWTYTHRGIVSPSQEKWIITGWFNYTEK